MASSRLRNATLFARACLRYFVHGRADKKIGRPRSVLIVQLAKLGDMVCTTPMFRAVKAAYPDCKVCVMGDRVNKALLEHNPDVDRYIVWEKNIDKAIADVHALGVDFGCMTGPSPEILAILYLAGIPLVAAPVIKNGFCPQETRVYRAMHRFVVTSSHRMGEYAAREYLRLLEHIGVYSNNTTKHLAFADESRARVDAFLRAHRVDPSRDFVVGISPSTGYKIKRWPAERFANVADYLSERYNAVIVLSGTNADGEEIKEMVKHLAPSTRIINALGQFGVDEMKALITRMKMFISVDTGPIYVAEAFGVPTVDIVGPMDEREQPPRGGKHRVVVATRQAPQLHIMNTAYSDEKEARRQVEDITVEMVVRAIEELMSRMLTGSL